MSDPARPNLFSYATSELSQDAFICWLAAWADPTYKNVDPELHQAGQAFIISLLTHHSSTVGEMVVSEIKICRQCTVTHSSGRGRLDVFIELSYVGANTITRKALIAIEDKIDASITDQLKIYENALNGDEKYLYHEKIFILFKTGIYDVKGNTGSFKLYSHLDLLPVLDKYTNRSEILDSFKDNLRLIESRLEKFRHGKWPQNYYSDNKYFLIGFHKWMLNSSELDFLQSAGYGYVNNAKGGFDGFWWNFLDCPNASYKSYLQLENDMLCFKIAFSDEILKQSDWKVFAKVVKWQWSTVLCRIFLELDSKHTKIGKTMTVAKLNNFLCLHQDDTLDVEKTIAVMKKAEEIMGEARKHIN